MVFDPIRYFWRERSFWICQALLVLVPLLVAYWRPKEEPDPDLVFAQITDPHLFDDGPKGGPQDPRIAGARARDRKAFLWAVGQINEFNEAHPRHGIEFVAFTGDLGLEALDSTNDPEGDCRQGVKPPNLYAKGPTVYETALTQLTADLRQLKVSDFFVVAGNNDIADENVNDQGRFDCFVKLVDGRLRGGPRVTQLGTDPVIWPKARKPGGGVYWLFGLNSASFKGVKPDQKLSTDEQEAQRHKNYLICPPFSASAMLPGVPAACPEEQMTKLLTWSRGHLNDGSAGLVFTHIPELRDPNAVRLAQYDRADSGWSIDGTALDAWHSFAQSPQVVGIFAGHFHESSRMAYHPMPDDPANAVLWNKLSVKSCVTRKTWVAPPLAEKFQPTGWPQARGFNIVRVRKGQVFVETRWYPGDGPGMY
jgi:hypothetical protein